MNWYSQCISLLKNEISLKTSYLLVKSCILHFFTAKSGNTPVIYSLVYSTYIISPHFSPTILSILQLLIEIHHKIIPTAVKSYHKLSKVANRFWQIDFDMMQCWSNFQNWKNLDLRIFLNVVVSSLGDHVSTIITCTRRPLCTHHQLPITYLGNNISCLDLCGHITGG